MQPYYLRVEAVNFDYSVYDTNDISTIRGGSFILLDAFNKLKAQMPNADIGTAASAGLFKIMAANDAAAKVEAEKASAFVSDQVGGFATILAEILPAADDKSFEEIMQRLAAGIRWQQYRLPTVVLPKETLEKEACKLNGVRPAVNDDLKGDQKIKVSKAVYLRRDRGRKLRQEFYQELLGKNDFSENTHEFTNDLETLSADAGRGALNGKIAFIHVDGNRFGRIRDHISTSAERLHGFQVHIQERIRKPAMLRLLQFAVAPKNKSFLFDNPKTKKSEIRLETLLWGGDEIEWVIPAWQALNVLKIFFDATADNSTFEDNHLTHAAGVIFCHHNLPILQVRRYARQLCDVAKQSIPTEAGRIDQQHNNVAFMNLSAFDLITGEASEFLEKYNAPAHCEDFVIRSAAQGLPTWERHLTVIKRYFPQNRIHEIIRALKSGCESDADKVLNRAAELIGTQNWQNVLAAIEKLTQNNQKHNRWFLIADLLNYLGEDK